MFKIVLWKLSLMDCSGAILVVNSSAHSVLERSSIDPKTKADL